MSITINNRQQEKELVDYIHGREDIFNRLLAGVTRLNTSISEFDEFAKSMNDPSLTSPTIKAYYDFEMTSEVQSAIATIKTLYAQLVKQVAVLARTSKENV